MKKLLSLLLAVAMVFSLLTSAFALEANDDGSVTYSFSRDALKTEDGKVIENHSTSETEGVWEWMEEPTSTEATKVHYGKGWFVGNVAGFGGHGWKYFDMNPAGLEAAVSEYKLGQLNTDKLLVFNRYKDTDATITSVAENDSMKLALALEKPENPGFYSVSITAAAALTDTNAAYYMNPESGELTAENSVKNSALLEKVSYTNTANTTKTLSSIVYVNSSDNLIFTINPLWNKSLAETKSQGIYAINLTLSPISGGYKVTTTENYLNVGEQVTATAYLGETPVANSFITWTSNNKNVVTVDAEGKVTAVGVGETIVYATVLDGTTTVEKSGITFRVYDPDYVAAFGEDAYTKESASISPSVEASVAALDGSELETTIEEPVYNEGTGTYSVSAPETIDDYTFRYWIKGLELKKQIVSLDNEITAYTPHNGLNYLIAVYDKAGTTPAKTEYYNANGQKLENGDTLPYMAGYGQAEGWIDHKNGIVEAYYGEPNTCVLSIEEDAPSEIRKKAGTYKYGDYIELTAPEKSGDKTFLGWRKKVNGVTSFVSVDETYGFYIWEDCTISPKYRSLGKDCLLSDIRPSGMLARRILLGTFDIGNGENAIMAEFIGFDNAVERGITIGAKDYTMTQKKASQYVIINDAEQNAEISGYAILADGYKYIYKYTVPEIAE